MVEGITQLGVAAVIVLLLLDRVTALVRGARGNGQSKSGASVEVKQAVIEANNLTLVPILDRQTRILENQQETLGEIRENQAAARAFSEGRRAAGGA